jgi:hypothetical protein
VPFPADAGVKGFGFDQGAQYFLPGNEIFSVWFGEFK